MNKRKALEAELAKIGITSEAELREAIRKEKPVNLSLMATVINEERKAS